MRVTETSMNEEEEDRGSEEDRLSRDSSETEVSIYGEDEEGTLESEEEDELIPPSVWLLERGSLRYCFTSSSHEDIGTLKATMKCYTGLMLTLMLFLLTFTLILLVYFTYGTSCPKWVLLGLCGLDTAIWCLIGYRTFYAIWGEYRLDGDDLSEDKEEEEGEDDHPLEEGTADDEPLSLPSSPSSSSRKFGGVKYHTLPINYY